MRRGSGFDGGFDPPAPLSVARPAEETWMSALELIDLHKSYGANQVLK